MESNWPFDQARDCAALTTVNVIERNLPILQVTHYTDDHSWAFLRGTTNEASDARVIGMEEALELDPSLAEIADLPPGWSAWREAIGEPWHRARSED